MGSLLDPICSRLPTIPPRRNPGPPSKGTCCSRGRARGDPAAAGPRLQHSSFPQSAERFGFVFLPLIVGITGNRPPNETPSVTPVVEQNALLKRLTPGRDHDDIVLARRSLKGFRPMKVERFKFQRIQPEQ